MVHERMKLNGGAVLKKTLSILLSLCLLLWSAAAWAAPGADAILKSCAEAMETLDSVSVKGTLTMGIEGLTNTATHEALSGEIVRKPDRTRTFHALMEGMGYRAEAYAEEQDGKFVAYTRTNGAWSKRVLGATQPANWLEPAALVKVIGDLAELSVEDAAQAIGGKEVICVAGTIDFRKILSIDGVRAAVQQAQNLLRIDALPEDADLAVWVKAYVETDSNNLLRLEIDVSRPVSAFLTATMPNQPGMEVQQLKTEFIIGLDFLDFNNVADFEIPVEVKI